MKIADWFASSHVRIFLNVMLFALLFVCALAVYWRATITHLNTTTHALLQMKESNMEKHKTLIFV